MLMADITPIKWQDSIWFADVDDTLINTAQASFPASEAFANVLIPHCGDDKAGAVQTYFNQMMELMLAGYRVQRYEEWQQVTGGKAAFDKLNTAIAVRQTLVQSAYGHVKKWSRELFIKLAAEKAEVNLSPELLHEAADAYWLAISQSSQVYPDALKLVIEIYRHKRPLYLVTSSDARLKMREDGQFTYDPAYSEGLKRQRMELLREKELLFNAVSIGDPEDKPHLDFFKKAVHIAELDLGTHIDPRNAIMVGDSFVGDLLVPKNQLNFGLVALREQGRKELKIDDERQITTGNLLEVTKFLA